MYIEIIQHNKTPAESVARVLSALEQPETKKLYYGKAVDKLTQYSFFLEKGLPHPEWSINYEDAQQWLANGSVVICRESVKGHSGSGVFVCHPGEEELIAAKIYVKYQKKKREFRVNLFKGKFVNIREKKRMAGAEGNTHVWTPSNGYTTVKLQTPVKDLQLVKDLAEAAAAVSESDFVGIDIIYNAFYDKYYILEVNSGPSIEGSSVDDYCNAIKEWMNESND